MSLSLVLLTTFLGFWLVESYHKEEENLWTQLNFEFIKVTEEVKDSMYNNLFENLIVEYKSQFKPSENINDVKNKLPIKSIDFDRVESIIKIKRSDSLTTQYSINLKDDQSPLNIITNNIEYFDQVKDKFGDRILVRGYPNQHTFIGHEIGDSATNVIADFVSNEPTWESSKTAGFENFGYILKKIIPQILFSLLLLLVVGFSFWQSWHTINKQKRLGLMKSNFVSNMAHELKTPISTVSVAIEALQDFNVLEDKNKSKEYLDISKNELSRLTLLVDKVLKMSRFDSHQNILKKEEDIDFLEIINAVSNSMKLQIEKYGAEYEMDFAQGNYNLKADKIHLTNVLYNLIDNALKYGGEKPKVFVRLEAFADKVVMSVKDSGIGIPKEYQDKIFERFFRVPHGDIHNTKGHGLGLSYARNVVEAHGGKMYFESQQGQGTTFTLEIPRND